MTNDTLQFMLIACCIIPTVITMGIVYAGLRGGYWLMQLIAPSEKRLIAQFIALREEDPTTSTRKLVGRVVQRQALRAGVVGAVTSVGGAFTLPIGLPLDVITTARIQATTLHLVAWAYELENPGQVPKVLDINEIFGLRNGGALTVQVDKISQQLILQQSERFSNLALRRALLTVGEKAFAKLIPGFGMFIGFAVNYFTARALGLLAIRWYSGNIQQVGQQIKAARESASPRDVNSSLLQAGQSLSRQAQNLRAGLHNSANN